MFQSDIYSESLFSYGTLCNIEVQQHTFKRLLTGSKDKLLGYKKETIQITDQNVVKLSGKEYHNIIVYTGNNQDAIDGMVFAISAQELKQADIYEVSVYKRVAVKLASGIEAWVYIGT